MRIARLSHMPTVRVRLLLAFACILGVLIVQSGFAIYTFHGVIATRQQALMSQIHLSTFRYDLAAVRINLLQLLGTTNPDAITALQRTIEQQFQQLAGQLDTLALPSDFFVQSHATYQEIITLHRNAETQKAYELMHTRSDREYEALSDMLNIRGGVIETTAEATLRHANRQFIVSICLLGVIGLLTTVFLERNVFRLNQQLAREIEEHTRIAEALRNSEERLNNVLEILPVGVWLADKHGVIVHGNPAGQHIWTGAHYVGPERYGEYKAWWVATGEALKPEDWGVARAITRGESSIEEEIEIECFDGTHKIILNWVVPLWGHDHTIEGAVVVNQDITERKRAEKTLRKSEERFRWLFDNSINAVALHEIVVNDRGEPVDYIFLNVNHGFEVHTGMRAADIVGKRVTQAFPGIEKTNLIAIYGNVALTGEPTSFEMYFEPLQRDYNITAYQVGKGRFAAVFEDITDRKRAEMALRESEERLRMVIDNSRDGINLLDLRLGRYTFMSPAQVELTGFSIEEMNDLPVEEAYERVHPDDREISISQQQRVAAGEDIVTPVEYRWKVKSGEYRWFSDSRKAIRDEQGRTIALVGVSRDITEYKRAEEALHESEERFHAALEASLQAFTIMRSMRDAQRRIIDFEWTYANPMAGEILKQPPETLVGRRLLDTLPGNRENRALFDRYVRIVESGQGDEMELEYVSEGISGWFRNMAVKLGDGVAISFSDITDHKRAEELLKNQNVRLEQAVQQKQREMEGLFERLLRQEKLATIGQMAGSIAHELRNPLGAVKQSVFYLKRLAQRQELTMSNPNVLRQLNLMDAELNISGRVITDLLDMTRMKPLQCQATDLRALLADAIARCHLPDQVRVTIALEPEQFVIFVDPLQMRQVVLNILTNAMQAITGEGAITIRARQLAEQQESVIEIHDNGVGLTPEALQKVFEPLYTTKAIGTGLGLSICKQIIESHDGRISLTSEPGQGATVTIALPWNDNRVTNY